MFVLNYMVLKTLRAMEYFLAGEACHILFFFFSLNERRLLLVCANWRESTDKSIINIYILLTFFTFSNCSSNSWVICISSIRWKKIRVHALIRAHSLVTGPVI